MTRCGTFHLQLSFRAKREIPIMLLLRALPLEENPFLCEKAHPIMSSGAERIISFYEQGQPPSQGRYSHFSRLVLIVGGLGEEKRAHNRFNRTSRTLLRSLEGKDKKAAPFRTASLVFFPHRLYGDFTSPAPHVPRLSGQSARGTVSSSHSSSRTCGTA